MLSAPVRPRLPLSRHPMVAAASLEQASEIYRRVAPMRLHDMRSTEPFSMRVNSLSLGPLALSAMDNTATVRAECEGACDAYLLSIPLGEASAESINGAVVTPVVRGKSGVLCSPWRDTAVLSRAGFSVLQLSMPRQAVLDAMTTLTAAEPREIQFQLRFALDAPHVEPFTRLLGQVLRAADAEHAPLAAAGVGERLSEALLFRFLLCQPHSRSALFTLSLQTAEPHHVRRAAEYLDTHLEQHVTMAELTRLTGVSARSLQLGFQKYRGCSPLSFMRARRLEHARVLLLTDDRVESVSEAAQRAGIEHLGRFSVRYRARFGESPMRTLGRRFRPG